MGIVGPACDGAEEGLTGLSKQEAGRGRGCSYVGIPFDLLLVRIRYRACSSPPRVRRTLAPTNGKAATDEIREIWR